MFPLLRSLYAHRRLLREFVIRDLKARYVGSSMGFFWSVIFPLLNLAVYFFVFRLILQVRWSVGASPTMTALMMLTGILIWTAHAETTSRATNCVVENANLIQKVVFPSEILAPYLAISSLVNMAIGLPVVLLSVVLLHEHEVSLDVDFGRLGWPLLALPVLLMLQCVFTVGLGYILGTLNVFLRDTFHVVGVAITLWMFATPIFYPDFLVNPELAPAGVTLPAGMQVGRFWWLLEVNPMYWLIECYRDVMLRESWPDWRRLGEFTAVSFGMLWLGGRFFMGQKRSFADLL